MSNNYLRIQTVFKSALAFLILVGFSSNSQAQYSVGPIPYQAYVVNSIPIATLDDTFSAPIPLTFNFDFYGTVYNQVNISTNGYISFTPHASGDMSPWSFNQTIPNANFPAKNAFLGCYHDLDNSNSQGNIKYDILGAAPYRKFVVIFTNQSHFSCTSAKSTFQMILYETLNILDVQLVNKEVCTTWNAGNAVTGIIDATGLNALTPVGRNTSAWTAIQEGWRFQRPAAANTYMFAKCDDNADGLVSFNLAVAQNDLLSTNPTSVKFYSTLADANAPTPTNEFSSLNYTNTTNTETIYARVNGVVVSVVLRVLDCASDYDSDSVATTLEDLNADTNLANDDTDADGIPDFIDNDDDGDTILTATEYVFNRGINGALAYLDSDNDGILNYLDNDDDGDGVLTINEDYNHNYNAADDDTNANSIPDYLENAVALGVNNFDIRSEVTIYPNPVSTVLNIENKSNETISNVGIYNINGALVKEIKSTEALQAIPVSDLQSGIYFVKIQLNQQVINYKFIKK